MTDRFETGHAAHRPLSRRQGTCVCSREELD